MAARTDDGALGVALKISSLMLWIFYSAAALYVAYCNSFFLEKDNHLVSAQSLVGQSTAPSLLQKIRLSHQYSKAYYFFFPDGFDIAAFIPLAVRAVGLSAFAIASTYYFAVKYEDGGEMLMFVAWIVGVLSEHYWLTSPVSANSSEATGLIRNATAVAASVATSAVGDARSVSTAAGDVLVVYDSRIPMVPGWLWLVVSMATGFFSGLMSKVKDITDGKVDRGDHLLGILEDDESGGAVPTVIDDVRVLQKRLAKDKEEPGSVGAERRGSASGAKSDGTGGGDGMDGGDGREMGSVAVTSHHRRRGRGARNFGSRFVALGERLYIVVPFWTGQWFAFILRHGWRGVFIENCVLILTLGMIGYTMLSFKLLREKVYRTSGRTTIVRYRRTVPISENGNDTSATVIEEEEETTVDLIDLISKIFTTSFGAVGVAVVAVNVFITMLAIPFLKALVKLNALVSSVGILVELFVYEMA